MKGIKCDRCGKFVTEGYREILLFDKDEECGEEGNFGYLCPDCQKELKKWMNQEVRK